MSDQMDEEVTMHLQRLQTKDAYSDFEIHENNIDPSFYPFGNTQDPANIWTLGIVNITDIKYVYASVAENRDVYGKWFRIPVTGKTCETNYDECIANGGWNAILTRANNASVFSIRVATEPNEFGVATGTEFLDIKADPQFEGGLLGIC
jgi:hypothetical protein